MGSAKTCVIYFYDLNKEARVQEIFKKKLFGMKIRLILHSSLRKHVAEVETEWRSCMAAFLERNTAALNGDQVLQCSLDCFSKTPFLWHNDALADCLVIYQPPEQSSDSTVDPDFLEIIFNDTISVQRSCLALSCVLQYAESVLGSVHILSYLRAWILPEISARIKQLAEVDFNG